MNSEKFNNLSQRAGRHFGGG